MDEIEKLIKLKHLLRGISIHPGPLEDIFDDDFIGSMEKKGEIAKHEGKWVLLE